MRARRLRTIALLLVVALALLGLISTWAVWAATRSVGPPMPWTRFGTEDVHSLAFAPDSVDRLFFGHHGGVLESRDGGRTWAPLPTTADAMGLRPGRDGSLVIAGHEVLVASRDGGASWAPIESDLPTIDIHAFARDPADPDRMWAYLATGGLYETGDGGTHWERVFEGHRPFLAAVTDRGTTALLAIDPFQGLVRSVDGGRTWTFLSSPEAFPVHSLATTLDGRVVVLGSTDELLRSDDGGRTWTSTPFPDDPFAIAVSEDGRTIAVVTKRTHFYRSDDRGRSWPGP